MKFGDKLALKVINWVERHSPKDKKWAIGAKKRLNKKK